MVALPKQYNTADLPDSGGSVLIPAGQYQALIVDSELKPTKDKTGQFLALKIVIIKGAHAHTEFIERLNIVNNNITAVEIAYKTLARISEAIGMTRTPADSSEIHNKPFMIQVDTEKGKPWVNNKGESVDGSDKSYVKKYLKLPVGGIVDNQAVVADPVAVADTVADAPASNPFANA